MDSLGKLKKILGLSMRPKKISNDMTGKISAPREQDVPCNDTTTCQDGYQCCYDRQSNPCECCPLATTCDPDCTHCHGAMDSLGKLKKILGLSMRPKETTKGKTEPGSSTDKWMILSNHTENIFRAFQPDEALAREAPQADAVAREAPVTDTALTV